MGYILFRCRPASLELFVPQSGPCTLVWHGGKPCPERGEALRKCAALVEAQVAWNCGVLYFGLAPAAQLPIYFKVGSCNLASKASI